MLLTLLGCTSCLVDRYLANSVGIGLKVVVSQALHTDIKIDIHLLKTPVIKLGRPQNKYFN